MAGLRLAVLFAATALLAGGTAWAGPWRVSADGYGPALIGMTRSQAAMALGQPLSLAAGPGPADPHECAEIQLRPGVWLMFEHERLTRVSLNKPGVLTDAGLRVGDPEARVRRAYDGRLKRAPAPYDDPPAHDLIVRRKSGRGFRFEIDAHGRVTAIHAGGRSIEYIEGCL